MTIYNIIVNNLYFVLNNVTRIIANNGHVVVNIVDEIIPNIDYTVVNTDYEIIATNGHVVVNIADEIIPNIGHVVVNTDYEIVANHHNIILNTAGLGPLIARTTQTLIPPLTILNWEELKNFHMGLLDYLINTGFSRSCHQEALECTVRKRRRHTTKCV